MITCRRYLSLASGVLLLSFFMAYPAFAQESAKQDPADSPIGMIFRWLNFLIVFGAISFLIAKHGGAFFSSNAKEISASIVEASAVKAEADRELAQAQAKTENLNNDLEKLRQEAQQNWTAEKERLRASSVAEIEKINQAAVAEMAASERAAQQQLRHVAAALSVERAAALVTSRMNPEIRSKMFQSFLAKLERGSN
ncbi:MAG TPA: ATP synthase F0 subunit B [Candidatus Acidoferrales bacterium]|jgi:F-type H+-transporting ATPase subunit b|nr:ATP synthase F0 subunit B [Candidatus Acidoferrales bacterium]